MRKTQKPTKPAEPESEGKEEIEAQSAEQSESEAQSEEQSEAQSAEQSEAQSAEQSEEETEPTRKPLDKAEMLHQARVKLGLVRMLDDRGYQLDKNDIEIRNRYETDDVIEFIASKDKYLEFDKVYEHTVDRTLLKTVFVEAADSDTINKPQVQRVIAGIEKEQVKGMKIAALVLIGNVPLGSKAIDKLLEKKNLFIQFFRTDELLYNPTEHDWCPTYEKLRDDEKSSLYHIEGIQIGSLPNMKYADLVDLKVEKDKEKFFIDPVCKYYGFRADKGDIVKETGRNIAINYLLPEYVTYRYVRR